MTTNSVINLAMKTLYTLLLSSALLVVTLLWLSSYTHHSSIGMDHDEVQQGRILHTFYRINWTGHGSILMGYGSAWKTLDPDRPLERFDPASSLLKPAKQPPVTHSFWNELGFWYIKSPSPRPTLWLGVPSYLPVMLLVLLLLISVRQLRKPH